MRSDSGCYGSVPVEVLVFSVLIIILSGMLFWQHGLAGYRYYLAADAKAVEAAKGYLRALAAGDIAATREVASGQAAGVALKLSGKGMVARVEDIRVAVETAGNSWTRVRAVVDLTLKDGAVDVGWYVLDVLKDGERWKVCCFAEVSPFVEGGYLGPAGREDLYEAEKVFKGYLDSLAHGSYREAARYLAGPALREHLAAEPVLGKGKIVDVVEGLAIEGIGQSGKLLILEARYRTEDRQVHVVVSLYRTAEGWKIVRVQKV